MRNVKRIMKPRHSNARALTAKQVKMRQRRNDRLAVFRARNEADVLEAYGIPC